MSVRDHGLEAIRKSAVEITPGDTSEYRLRTSGEGVFTPSGLTTGGLITTMDIGDTALSIPATALTSRNHIEIHNKSNTDTVYVGFTSGVTADSVIGTTSGKEILPNSFWNIDITDNILVYGIAETGKTIRIKVVEVA